MKLRARKSFTAEVATASLNDIMFFLLLFFLIVSTVANPNLIRVLLPSANASQSLSMQPVSLSVTKDRRYFIDKDEIPFAQLESTLVKRCKSFPEPTVVIRFAHDLTIQDLVNVMQIGSRHRIKMVLATTKR
jgi:biopolymer transport protein ExbD